MVCVTLSFKGKDMSAYLVGADLDHGWYVIGRLERGAILGGLLIRDAGCRR